MSRAGRRRVAITGMGAVTPLGLGVEPLWSALAAGLGAVRRASLADGVEEEQLAARVPDFSARDYISNRRLLRLMCRTDQFGLAAAQMAVTGAGEADVEPARKGAFIGTSKEMGPIEVLFDAMRTSRDETGEMTARRLGSEGFSEIPPLTLVNGLPNACLFAASVIHSIKGPNSNLLGSGEVGLMAIAAAYRAIQEGLVDWALAGAHDSGVDRWSYANFHRLGMLSKHVEDPGRAVRPFDRNRDGFAVSEGGGMVVLEDLETARARGAGMYAELLGFCATCDAAGQVAPLSDGSCLARAISVALDEAELQPHDVGYLNAYASATPTGDRTELRALEAVFGATSPRPLVSGIKGALGHMLAASGAVELIATALAIRHQVVPPTVNLQEPDTECRFDCVPGQARAAELTVAVTLSRGIGGQNAVMVLGCPGEQ